MYRPTEIQTTEIDLAAVYMAATGKEPLIFWEKGVELVKFIIPINEETNRIMVEYATGTLCLNVRKYASCRNSLYRRVKAVAR